MLTHVPDTPPGYRNDRLQRRGLSPSLICMCVSGARKWKASRSTASTRAGVIQPPFALACRKCAAVQERRYVRLLVVDVGGVYGELAITTNEL